MNGKFDSPRCRAVAAGELAKNMAQSVTRRGALKRFGVGFAGVVLGSLGLASKAEADPSKTRCQCNRPYYGCTRYRNPNLVSVCLINCTPACSP